MVRGVRQTPSELARELLPHQNWGLGLVLVTGVLMFVATAVRCYGNTSFWVKMSLLTVALIFHFAYFRKLVRKTRLGQRWAIDCGVGTLLVVWRRYGGSCVWVLRLVEASLKNSCLSLRCSLQFLTIRILTPDECVLTLVSVGARSQACLISRF